MNKTNNKPNLPSKGKNQIFSAKTVKNLTPGQFPCYEDGRLIKVPGVTNRAIGYEPNVMSWERLFKKTPEERLKLKKLKNNWHTLMRMQYGDNWSTIKGGNSPKNPSVRVNKITKEFQLV